MYQTDFNVSRHRLLIIHKHTTARKTHKVCIVILMVIIFSNKSELDGELHPKATKP